MEDTEILALRRYVHEMTSIRRSQGTERTIRNVSRFVFDIQNYLMDNGTEVSKIWMTISDQYVIPD